MRIYSALFAMLHMDRYRQTWWNQEVPFCNRTVWCECTTNYFLEIDDYM